MKNSDSKIEALECRDLDDQGRGVCQYGEGVVFVDGILPTEQAQVAIDYGHGKVFFGHLVKLLKASPDRVKPECPYYPLCGGCTFTHLAYPKRLLFKQDVIKRSVKKFGGLDLPVLPTIPCPVETGFRNKVQKPVGYDRKTHRLICGFYRENSHKIVPATGCISESPLSIKITGVLMDLLNSFGYTAYDEDSGEGQIRHVLIKTSYHYPEALVTIVSADPNLKGITDLAKALVAKVPEVKGVVLNVNRRHTNVILGMEEHQVYGYTKIRDQILGKEFTISSRSFFQTNPVLLDTLYGKAIEAMHLTGKERVLDAYCGTGTIGICAADKALNVTGVEIERASYDDAKANAKLNKAKNVFFRNQDATEFMEETKGNFDVVVLDPPRKGTTPQFIRAVFRMKPKRVVYVSCDPTTLGRDLGLFKEHYDVDYIQGVDMFPTTHHIETVVSLSLKNVD